MAGFFTVCGARHRWTSVLVVATWLSPCVAQQWQQAVPGGSNAQLVHDVVRDRTRLFALASTSVPHVENWYLAADVWRQRFPPTLPPCTGPATYDLGHARTVMVLGRPQLATWEFDGTNWSRATTAAAPSARADFCLAYDLARMEVVLFGGFDMRGVCNDTWIYDGTNWRQLTSVNAPPARLSAAMCFDVARSVTVLFGGGTSLQDPGLVLDDTWQFDGTAWSQITVAMKPPARTGAAATCDVWRNQTVMFGGFDARTQPLHDTWTLDGTKWTPCQPAHQPPERAFAAMTYDWTNRRTLLFGGFGHGGESSDTWAFDGVDWSQLRDTAPTTCDAAMVGDRAHDRVLMFSSNKEAAVADTLAWDGVDWRLLRPTTSPPNRSGHCLVYDARRARALLFGGMDPDERLCADTWAFEGTDWRQLRPSTAPAPRAGAAMAYDDDRDRIVLFGGGTATALVDETWEFDGAQWQRRRPRQSPVARNGACMVYDLARSRAVLFGGNDGVASLGDTWEYDGADWVLVATAASPPPRQLHTMSYDRHRARTVLFGGQSIVDDALDDLWEYDGRSWTAVAGPGPDAMNSAALAYDARRRRQVLHGGPPGAWQRQTWERLPPMAATFARCGRGCPGSAGVPTLDTVDGQLPWLGTTLQLQLGELPLGPGFAILGVAFEPSRAALPHDAAGLPGCLRWIVPEFDRVIAHGGTAATVAMRIPFDPLLHGLEVGLQFVSFDPGAPGGVGALSNGALLVLR